MTPADARLALRNIRRFLTARLWTLARTGERMEEYRPPADLRLPDTFVLALPRDADFVDTPRLISHVEDSLAHLYADSLEQIEPVLESADSVLSLKVEDDLTRSGSIGLDRFDRMIAELRKLIVHTAAFVTEEDPIVEKLPPEALSFLTACRFLQTSRGSFVANVQLPSDQVLRDASLLNPQPVMASEVTQRLSRVLRFVAGPVFERTPGLFSEAHLRQHFDVVNLNVLEDVEGLFKEAGDTSLVFGFLSVEDSGSVVSGRLTQGRTDTLTKYVDFVRDVLTEHLPIQIEGKVVELRSRNPQGNRNYVLVQADYENRPTYFALTVPNDRYATAVQAHRANRRVRLTGQARRMKTQMKMTDIVEFAQL